MNVCACGCGERLIKGGSYRTGHSSARPVAPRFLVDENGCWVWQRRVYRGYAIVWRDGRNALAHRVYFEERRGFCPDTLDHLCRNTRCVNPDHLEPCSRGENVRRGDVAVLDWGKVAEIRRYAGDHACSAREIGRRLSTVYGVSPHTIRQVVGGSRWAETARPEGC